MKFKESQKTAEIQIEVTSTNCYARFEIVFDLRDDLFLKPSRQHRCQPRFGTQWGLSVLVNHFNSEGALICMR